MTLLNALVASSAVALGVLISSAAPASALVAQGGHGFAARNGVSLSHNGMMKRNVNPSNPGQACGDNAKVGLAWGPSMSSNYIINAISSKTCWYYTSSAWPADSSFTGGLKFVPMLLSADEFRSQVIENNANYGVALAMNGVNQQDQSQMSPGDGVTMWNEYMVPLKQKGYTVISPSNIVSSGTHWMQEWINGGLWAQPDALAIHWYGKSFNDFRNDVEIFMAAFPNCPLWITEFACIDLDGGNCDAMAFANQAIPYLDDNSAIQAYFPLGFDGTMSNVGEPSRLMNRDGSLTDLGRRYLY